MAGFVFVKPSFLRTFVLVLAAVVALFGIDTFLARVVRIESRAEGERLYREGQRLKQLGHIQDAADRFRAATVVARDNQQYQLALGQALLAAGHVSDAEATLADLLERDPTGGPPNLAMAQVAVKQNRITEAVSYYHRAIYGQWKQDARNNRVRVRFGLLDLLAAQNSKEELLAELLPLLEEAPDDIPTRKRIGRLFIIAGSPARGADLFREVLRRSPQDPEAYAGLGEADFARGSYRSAQANFQTALSLRPADEEIRRRLDLCAQVLALDPTLRGLGEETQFQRSVKLIQLALDELHHCVTTPPDRGAKDLLDAAGKALKGPVPRSARHTALEANLDLADQLWQLRKASCKEAATDPLALVLTKVAQ
jgi:tetratricopeptide (TPR) repeat protein